MLSAQEKKEMLVDGESLSRRADFRAAQRRPPLLSLDDYLHFLASVQKIFGPFRICRRPTLTAGNKL
jgi:hypothetical protein